MIPKTLLLILDGYGLAEALATNAATSAHTPTLDRLFSRSEMARLDASGEAVGLPPGFIGNSEVGHLNIGGGRLVKQDMMSIDYSIEHGEIYKHPVLLDVCQKIKKAGGRLHLMGLLSDGGVHSHINHAKALIRLGKEQGVPIVFHAFLDGRDTSPTSAADYVRELLPCLSEYGAVFGDICGRYYAMDRDKRWERVEKAWNMLVHGDAENSSAVKNGKPQDPIDIIENCYAQGQTDEFILPHLLIDPKKSCVQDGDGLFCFNFRSDRVREIMHAFYDVEFSDFERGKIPLLSAMASMTIYDSTLAIPAVFEKDVLHETLGEVVEKLGLSQLRIAETEKYAHVTYFLSGGREDFFKNEKRLLIPSPKEVATYDLKPEMSAVEVTDTLMEAWQSGAYDFVVCNLANADMVGHTGNLKAAILACEVVDVCVARLEKMVIESGGMFCITADHGNVEVMADDKGKPHTAHSMNQVPLVIETVDGFIPLKKHGKLGDIAPTILTLWKQNIPSEMNGDVLTL